MMMKTAPYPSSGFKLDDQMMSGIRGRVSGIRDQGSGVGYQGSGGKRKTKEKRKRGNRKWSNVEGSWMKEGGQKTECVESSIIPTKHSSLNCRRPALLFEPWRVGFGGFRFDGTQSAC
jgi:hypothetical protein